MKYADLQLHTRYSDGTETPAEILYRAKKNAIDCVSITDHDTTAGIPEALKASVEFGMEVIPGIEISCDCSKGTLHILGYYMDILHPVFQASLRYFREARNLRIYKIIDALRDYGLDITVDDVFEEVKGDSPGRPHVAQVIINKGYAKNRQDAFDRFLAHGKPGDIEKAKMRPHEAVNMIHSARGLAVLAHPHSLDDIDVIRRLVIYGLDGIEVFYPEHSHSFIQTLANYVKKYRLFATGGSDCHGAGKDEVRLGKIKLPYSYILNMKKCYERKYGNMP